MKKFLSLIAILFLAVSVTGCGANSTNNSDETKNTDSSTNESSVSSEQISKFDQFEKALTTQGITYEKNEKSATLVGAKEGYGYVLSDETSVELYLFNKTDESYKTAKANNELNLESFEIKMPVDFNDDIAIYYNGTPTQKDIIKQIFENLK